MDMPSIILNPKTINDDWPLIVALKEGKVIQYEAGFGCWYDYTNGSLDFNNAIPRRIKPEPKLRAWNKVSEVPIGCLVKNINPLGEFGGQVAMVIGADPDRGIRVPVGWITFAKARESLVYTIDGGKTSLPCGITE